MPSPKLPKIGEGVEVAHVGASMATNDDRSAPLEAANAALAIHEFEWGRLTP